MVHLSRRSVLRGSLYLAAGTGLARPYVANAQAKTASLWWVQGFAQEEDVAFKKLIEDYQKISGNVIDYSIVPYAPLRQKIVSAITSGGVPDIIPSTPVEAAVLFAWDDKLVDVSDVIATQKQEYTDAQLLSSFCANRVTRSRTYYAVPFTTAALPNHVWRSLVEKAGYKIADIPKTWDAYYNFFKDVQKQLRAKGDRHIYGLGFQLTTNGNDPNNTFNYFLIAYGGAGLVTKDGRLHLDDPQVREAAIKAIDFPTRAYKEGFVPPSAVNWNDADDNNAFHSKQVVMDLDGTISTEVAIIKNKQDYDDIETMGLPLGNDGKPVPTQVTGGYAMIPKGAKNVEVAKDFLKYFIQPKVNNEYLKTGLGRSIPPMASIARNDPWWTADPHRKAYVEQGLLGPTVPEFYCYNPAYAQVRNEHVWSTAWVEVMNNGVAPKDAAEKAFKRINDIFAKYPIQES